MPRWLLSRSALPAGAALAVTAGLAPFAHLTLPAATVIAFIIFTAIGELLEVTLPWEDSRVTMGMAPAVGYMLALDCNRAGDPASVCSALGNGPAEVALIFAGGAAIALAVRALRRKNLRLEAIAAASLTVIAASAAYAGLARLDPWDAFGPPNISILGLAGVFVVGILLDAAIPSITTMINERLPVAGLLRSRVRASAALQVASTSVGSLLALAYPALGNWALPLFLAPLGATAFSFRQFEAIRTTYLQTVRALAKVPEMAGYTQPGHSMRVAALSVEIGQEMGVNARDLDEVEYAALLHDIGRVSLPDPESAGETTYRLELALVGAAIVDQTGYLPRVATMIRQQHEPYRRRGEDQNKNLDAGSKIIKVASAYDDLTNPGGLGRSSWDALERMHLGMAYEFDPAVIQSLTRVLEKRGMI